LLSALSRNFVFGPVVAEEIVEATSVGDKIHEGSLQTEVPEISGVVSKNAVVHCVLNKLVRYPNVCRI